MQGSNFDEDEKRNEVRDHFKRIIRTKFQQMMPSKRLEAMRAAMDLYDSYAIGSVSMESILQDHTRDTIFPDAPPTDGDVGFYLPYVLYQVDAQVKQMLDDRTQVARAAAVDAEKRERDEQAKAVKAMVEKVMQRYDELLAAAGFPAYNDGDYEERRLRNILINGIVLFLSGNETAEAILKEPPAKLQGVPMRLIKAGATDASNIRSENQALLQALIDLGEPRAATINEVATREAVEKAERARVAAEKREIENMRKEAEADARRTAKMLEGRVRKNSAAFDKQLQEGRENSEIPLEGERRKRQRQGKQVDDSTMPKARVAVKTDKTTGKMTIKTLRPEGVKEAQRLAGEMDNVSFIGAADGEMHTMVLESNRHVTWRSWAPPNDPRKSIAITGFALDDGRVMRVFRMRTCETAVKRMTQAEAAAAAAPPADAVPTTFPQLTAMVSGAAGPSNAQAVVNWGDDADAPIGFDEEDEENDGEMTAEAAQLACNKYNEEQLLNLANDTTMPREVLLHYSDGTQRLWLKIDYQARVLLLPNGITPDVAHLPKVVSVLRLGGMMQLDPAPQIRPAALLEVDDGGDAYDGGGKQAPVKTKRVRRTPAEIAALRAAAAAAPAIPTASLHTVPENMAAMPMAMAQQMPVPPPAPATAASVAVANPTACASSWSNPCNIFIDDIEDLQAPFLAAMPQYNHGDTIKLPPRPGVCTGEKYDGKADRTLAPGSLDDPVYATNGQLPYKLDRESHGVGIYVDSSTNRKGPNGRNIRYDVKYRTYVGKQRKHFSHGRYWDAYTANTVCNWLLTQPKDVRMCNGAGRRFLELLMPAAIERGNGGMHIKCVVENGTNQLYLGRDAASLTNQNAAWGAAAPGDIEIQAARIEDGAKIDGLYGERISIRPLSGGAKTSIGIANPFAAVAATVHHEESAAIVIAEVRGLPPPVSANAATAAPLALPPLPLGMGDGALPMPTAAAVATAPVVAAAAAAAVGTGPYTQLFHDAVTAEFKTRQQIATAMGAPSPDRSVVEAEMEAQWVAMGRASLIRNSVGGATSAAAAADDGGLNSDDDIDEEEWRETGVEATGAMAFPPAADGYGDDDE